MDDESLDERIRQRAYALWEAEGRPSGREDAHWDMATELIAIEDNQKLATKPIDSPSVSGPSGEPAEPGETTENLGDFPTAMTDQGEQSYPPRRATLSAEPQPAASPPRPSKSRG